ncbi:MAG: AgmX/PglI C-terminal domain-containing protein [Polyangiaceae bacterium]|nr:AgmX/PglI C-terminal domain-containing protein [Polyangiaceae bacterium]
MQEETPGIPTKGNGGLIALLLLMVLGGGAAVAWKLNSGPPATPAKDTQQKPSVAAPAPKEKPALAFAPPPPPPEEAPAPSAADSSKSAPAVGQRPQSRQRTSSCSKECKGNATPALKSAVSGRAGQARSCYNNALRLNPELRGKMTVTIKVDDNGSVCTAAASNNSLNDAGVTSCILQKFKTGKYPRPTGGCISLSMPLNFVRK